MSLGYFKTDKALETDGVWMPLPEGGEVKLARIGNPEFKKLYAELERPYKKLKEVGGKVPEAKQTEILIESFAKTIIKDWREVKDENDKELPYSYEAAKKALEDYEDFRDVVAAMASNMENYRAKRIEADAKN